MEAHNVGWCRQALGIIAHDVHKCMNITPKSSHALPFLPSTCTLLPARHPAVLWILT